MADLGWVDIVFFPLPHFVWAGGNAEVAEQLGKMVVVDHPKLKSTQLRFAMRWATLYTEAFVMTQ